MEKTTGASRPDLITLARCKAMLRSCVPADKRYRKRAIEGVEFYFDRQWSDDDKKETEDRGMPAIVINRIKPTVRLAHGLSVSQPMDWIAKPIGRNDDNVAESATAALKYISGSDVNDIPSIESKVFWWALTYGVGYAIPGFFIRNPDSRSEPVQIVWPDSREIRIDPKSKEDDASDAGFFIWSRELDLADMQAKHPEFKEQLAAQVDKKDPNLGGENIDSNEGIINLTPNHSAWAEAEGYQGGDGDIITTPKVVVHELWERYPEKVMLMEHKDGYTHEFDPQDPEQAKQIGDPDVVRYYESTIYKVRYHVFCGNILLVSEPSPYKHDRLPLVCCFYERDEHGDPVSMVESLKDPQREINHRRSKMLWELSNRQLQIDPDALGVMGMDEDEAAAHAADPGAVWLAKQGQINYLTRGELPSQQFQLMQDAKNEIQAVSGANDDLMGYDSSSKSGKAKEIQRDQGSTIMRPAEANLRRFHKQLGEQLLALIQQAHTEEWIIRITDDVGKDKFITLNQKELDPATGQHRILNDISQAKFEIEIDSMPWTPTLRERASQMLIDLSNGEPDPVIRQALKRAAIQMSDMPEKSRILDIYGQAQEQQQAAIQQQQMAQQQQLALPPGMGAQQQEGGQIENGIQ